MATYSASALARQGVKASEIARLRNQGKVVDYEHGPAWSPDWSEEYGHTGGGSSSSSAKASGSSSFDAYFKNLQQIAAQNNVWSAAQAQKQMDFQASQGAIARQFNHDEAELNRLWQERMSNTSHQREIKDLQAAGLNPVLSAMGGSGAPVTSGATASGYSPGSGAKGDTDTSTASALVNLLGYAMQTQASMANATLSAATQERIAQLGARTDVFQSLIGASSAREVANIGASSSLAVARVHAGATITSANINALATQAAAKIHAAAQVQSSSISANANIISASIHAAASRYGTDVQDAYNRDAMEFNATLQKELQRRGFDHNVFIQEDKQSHEWKMIVLDDVIEGLFGLGRSAIMSGALNKDSSKRVLGFLAGLS